MSYNSFTILTQLSFRFGIHRSVLAAASGFFAALYKPNFADSENKEFTVRNVDGAALKKIVDCCYSGRIELDDDCVHDIAKMANFMGFAYIERKCVEYLDDSLNWQNCVNYYMLADQLNYQNLRSKSLEMICQEFMDITLHQIARLDKSQLLDILKSDEIEAPEEMVFDYVQKWVECDEDERSAHVAELMNHIQLKYISGEVNLSNPYSLLRTL